MLECVKKFSTDHVTVLPGELDCFMTNECNRVWLWWSFWTFSVPMYIYELVCNLSRRVLQNRNTKFRQKNKNSKRLLSVLFALNMIVSYDQLLQLFSYKEINLYGPMSNSATQNKKQTHDSKINYHSKSSRIWTHNKTHPFASIIDLYGRFHEHELIRRLVGCVC